MDKVIVITNAEYISGRTLDLTFNDGIRANIDFSNWIERLFFFEPLRDVSYFKNFSLDGWTVVWPNGADIAPEKLYSIAVKASDSQAA